MTIKDLDKNYEFAKKLSTFISNNDEQGKYINKCVELNYLLQCLSLCDLIDFEYEILSENIEKMINILRLNYDNIIEEKRKKDENDNNRD